MKMYHVDGFDLKACAHCGGEPDFEYKENYSAHRFWRVVCGECGIGTWCDEDDARGYEDDPGKARAAAEWNRRAE